MAWNFGCGLLKSEEQQSQEITKLARNDNDKLRNSQVAKDVAVSSRGAC
eukprot:CAMPEP_0204343598 /NCGR_PEP_ID=MMETSP0469-20131031/25015_1 /ASSEMBLY_ACC=CAM_ASM_000384 /TAXON_ID=2969 /ORGANISM="Oxyrrhis marina" /LENGTH=48 /DNA_ID= /DNA_START= /DNA_END= /DNA_ORIENTATION=